MRSLPSVGGVLVAIFVPEVGFIGAAMAVWHPIEMVKNAYDSVHLLWKFVSFFKESTRC